MAFRIIDVETNGFWIDPATGLYAEFETGEEAQRYAKTISSAQGLKLRVKRVTDTRWVEREAGKFASGKYHQLPWHTESWWHYCRHKHQKHFAHPSLSNPGMIAYTESDEKGMDNIQTQIKPGKYLAMFQAELNEARRSLKTLETMFRNIYEPRTIHWAKTADEIQWVYETGPDSCMAGRDYRYDNGYGWPHKGEWPLGMHACRTYATEHGDLAVAYLTKGDKPAPHGKVQARALVFVPKKTYSRIYGEVAALKHQLESQGFKPAAPVGARIARHPVGEGNGMKFVAPYIDAGHSSGQGSLALKDMKTHLLITTKGDYDGYYSCGNTSGLSGPINGGEAFLDAQVEHCQNCSEHIEEVGDLERVYMNGSTDRVLWCQGCMDEYAFYCSRMERYFHAEYVEQVEMANGDTWSNLAVRQYGFRCAGTGEYHPRNERVTMADGATWSSDYFDEHGFTCQYSGDHYPNEQRVEMADGSVFSHDMFRRYGFHCPTCERNLPRVMRVNSELPNRMICIACYDEERAAAAASAATNAAEELSHD